jgi:hypothetical protein
MEKNIKQSCILAIANHVKNFMKYKGRSPTAIFIGKSVYSALKRVPYDPINPPWQRLTIFDIRVIIDEDLEEFGIEAGDLH